MRVKYFLTIGEAYREISKKNVTTDATLKVSKTDDDLYCIYVYDVFGEFLGVLQEDGTVRK